MPSEMTHQTVRAGAYARYSSDSQRDASIDDQIRVCRTEIERNGWDLVQVYTDAAISGVSTFRPGYQKLLQDASAGALDIVVAESLDRLSRDLADVATLFKHLSFLDVRLWTVAEGQINELHVGLKGTMNVLALKDLAQKTHRGLRGRIDACKSGGGNSYGYDVAKKIDDNGEPVRGERRINPHLAAIVKRILSDTPRGMPSGTVRSTDSCPATSPASKVPQRSTRPRCKSSPRSGSAS